MEVRVNKIIAVFLANGDSIYDRILKFLFRFDENFFSLGKYEQKGTQMKENKTLLKEIEI